LPGGGRLGGFVAPIAAEIALGALATPATSNSIAIGAMEIGAGEALGAGTLTVGAGLLAKEASTIGKEVGVGTTVFRVFGGDSAAGGASWSPINPASVSNFREVAGLPTGGASGFNNTGRFVIEGTLVDPSKVVQTRPALPLDGNVGGLDEFIIPNWMDNGAIRVDRVSGANPEF